MFECTHTHTHKIMLTYIHTYMHAHILIKNLFKYNELKFFLICVVSVKYHGHLRCKSLEHMLF